MEAATKKHLIVYTVIVDGEPTPINTDSQVGIMLEKGKYDLFRCTRPLELTGNPGINRVFVAPVVESVQNDLLRHFAAVDKPRTPAPADLLDKWGNSFTLRVKDGVIVSCLQA